MMSNTPYFDEYEESKRKMTFTPQKIKVDFKKYYSKMSNGETYLKDIELNFYDANSKKIKLNIESIFL